MFHTGYTGFARIYAVPITNRLEWAVEAGVEVPVSFPAELWRAGANKVHTFPGCQRLPLRARIRSVEFDEVPTDKGVWCAQCCAALPAGRLGHELRAAEVAAKLIALLADPDADPSDMDLFAAEALIRARNAGPLVARLTELAAAASERSFEAVRSPAARRRAELAAALADIEGVLVDGHPDYPARGAHLHPETSRRAARVAFQTLRRALGEPSSANDPLGAATAAAVAAAVRHVREEASPQDAEPEVHAAVAHWCNQAQDRLDQPERTVLVRARMPGGARLAWNLCRPFDPVFNFDRGVLVVVIPQVVANRLRREQRWTGGHCSIAELSSGPATREQLHTALEVFADEPDCDPAELFSATCLALTA